VNPEVRLPENPKDIVNPLLLANVRVVLHKKILNRAKMTGRIS
jgi:hypothetical protein